MGKRGPSPKPTPIRVLEGNPSRRPINENEPKPTDGTPPMPPHLDRRARVVWRQIAPELSRLGLLTVVDGEALASYCTAARLGVSETTVINLANHRRVVTASLLSDIKEALVVTGVA